MGILNQYSASFGLIRTNPKLSGNIKIVVDSKGNIFLESINANKELSSDRYKRYVLNPESSYSSDVYKFLRAGKIPSDYVYENFRKSDDLTVKESFADQYEDTYICGAERLNSNLYDEDNSIFAPFWLKEELPEKFIIFKLKKPSPLSSIEAQTTFITGKRYKLVGTSDFSVKFFSNTYENGEEFIYDTDIDGDNYVVLSGNGKLILNEENHFEETLKNPKNFFKYYINDAEIIKVYDLSEDSNIGKYIRNHRNDQLFPKSPIRVNFESDEIVYRGISIEKGVLVEKKEKLSEFFEKELPIIAFDDYVTAGFERNKLLVPNLLNLEFAFDDEVSGTYELNRYYGFYCSTIEMGDFLLDGGKAYENREVSGNLPILKEGDLTIESIESFISENPNGIKTYIDLPSATGSIFDGEKINEAESIFYLEGKGNLYKIKNCCQDEGFDYRLNNEKIDWLDLTGFDEVFLEEKGVKLSSRGRASSLLTINGEFLTGDEIEFFYKGVSIGMLIGDDLPDYDEEYGEGQSVDYFFYPFGSPRKIAKAISLAFNETFDREHPLRAVAHENTVIFITETKSSESNDYRVQINLVSEENVCSLFNEDFIGGTDSSQSRIRIPKDSLVNLTGEYKYVGIEGGLGKIRHISHYFDEVQFDQRGEPLSFKDWMNYYVITVSDEEKIKVNSGLNITLHKLFRPKMGVLSIFPVKDFDFDFDYSTYDRSHEIEQKKYYDVKNLEPDNEYKVFKRPNDTIQPIIEIEISSGNFVQYVNGGIFSSFYTTDYRVIQGNPLLINIKYENDEELKTFIGFNSFYDNTEVNEGNISQFDIDAIENKAFFLGRKRSATEYDRLRENQTTEFATKSRISPHINKWVIKNGYDIRDNKYRLNFSQAFGILNFSPSFTDRVQNPLYFTHEWYYLNGIPENISTDDLLNSYSYFNRIFEMERISNMDKDYFTDYFTLDSYLIQEGTNTVKKVVNKQERYSLFEIDESGFANTIFKGVKIIAKERVENKTEISGNLEEIKIVSQSKRFEGYKFSCILNIIKTKIFEPRPTVEVTILENKEHKNITCVITFVCDDYKVNSKNLFNIDIPSPDYLSLYVLKSLKSWDSGSNAHEYGSGFGYPFIAGASLYNDNGTGVPVGGPIQSFRGIQLNDKLNPLTSLGLTSEIVSSIRTSGDFLKQIKNDPFGITGRLIFMKPDGTLGITSTNGYYSASEYLISKPSTFQRVIDESTLEFDLNGFYLINVPSMISTGNYNYNTIPSLVGDISRLTWFYENGGYNLFEDSINDISFAGISGMINGGIGPVKYKSYSIEEGIIKETENEFLLEFQRPAELPKTNKLLVERETNNLPELPHDIITGYKISTYSQQVREKYFRYSGNYEPKTTDILFFTDDLLRMTWGLEEDTWEEAHYTWIEPLESADVLNWSSLISGVTINGHLYALPPVWSDFSSVYWNLISPDLNTINDNLIPKSKKLKFLNTKFNTDFEDFGKIRNVYYHKANLTSTPILKTENPLYPLLDEIAIDRKDFHLFSSNWDAGYYVEFLEKFRDSKKIGTRGIKEMKSFFGSKILKIPKEIKFDIFKSVETGNLDGIIPNNVLDGTDAFYQVRKNVIRFRLLLNNKLLEYFSGKVEEIFAEFVNPEWGVANESLKEYTKRYLRENVLPNYRIDNFELYTKVFKENSLGLKLVESEKTLIERLVLDYGVDKNSKFDKNDDFDFAVLYNMSENYSYSFNFSVIIKRI